MLEIKFKKLDARSVIPFKSNPGDAGLDLVAVENKTIFSGKYERVLTGLAVELPKGHEGQVRSRSGLASKHGLSVLNSPGTIDEGYRGEIGVILINHGDKPYTVNIGDKIAQLVISPVPEIQVLEVEDLSDSVRGEGGFGSTGVNVENKPLILWGESAVYFDKTITCVISYLPYNAKATITLDKFNSSFEFILFANDIDYTYKEFFDVRLLSDAQKLAEAKIIKFIEKIKADDNKKSLRDNILNNCQEQVYPESQDKPIKEDLEIKLACWIAEFTEIPNKLEGKIKDPYNVFEVAEKFVKELSIHINKYHDIIKGVK